MNNTALDHPTEAAWPETQYAKGNWGKRDSSQGWEMSREIPPGEREKSFIFFRGREGALYIYTAGGEPCACTGSD